MKCSAKGVCAAKGFTANGIHVGIRDQDPARKDLALIYSEQPGTAACVYTTNKVKGAPIQVTKAHLKNGTAQAIVVNSGNANTCNADGIEIAEAMCDSAAHALDIDPEKMMIASTGVIGQPLPLGPITANMAKLTAGLDQDGHTDAAQAIMTTDTHPKEYAVTFELDGKPCALGGMAKGSGMIHPNMATMLSFVTTDVNISAAMLTEALHEVCADTYNMIYIDGDTSTNDTFGVLANGMAGNACITEKNEDYQIFKKALYEVAMHLSKMLAKDGEGATKLLTCKVTGGASVKDAKAIAMSVVSSTLLKCAIFGEDANWGRILCAIGYADAKVDIDQVDVDLISAGGDVAVCRDGHGIPFSEDKALEVLKQDEITVSVVLHDGTGQAEAWGCDMTYEYVKINGEYRT
jgi:glutamate N-acetyltransferase/amino-acid N-acetyltransferase